MKNSGSQKIKLSTYLARAVNAIEQLNFRHANINLRILAKNFPNIPEIIALRALLRFVESGKPIFFSTLLKIPNKKFIPCINFSGGQISTLANFFLSEKVLNYKTLTSIEDDHRLKASYAFYIVLSIVIPQRKMNYKEFISLSQIFDQLPKNFPLVDYFFGIQYSSGRFQNWPKSILHLKRYLNTDLNDVGSFITRQEINAVITSNYINLFDIENAKYHLASLRKSVSSEKTSNSNYTKIETDKLEEKLFRIQSQIQKQIDTIKMSIQRKDIYKSISEIRKLSLFQMQHSTGIDLLERIKTYDWVKANRALVELTKGVIYSSIGGFNDAEECFKLSIRLDPKNQDGYLKLVYCYEEAKENEKADSVVIDIINRLNSFVDREKTMLSIGRFFQNKRNNRVKAHSFYKSAFNESDDNSLRMEALKLIWKLNNIDDFRYCLRKLQPESLSQVEYIKSLTKNAVEVILYERLKGNKWELFFENLNYKKFSNTEVFQLFTLKNTINAFIIIHLGGTKNTELSDNDQKTLMALRKFLLEEIQKYNAIIPLTYVYVG